MNVVTAQELAERLKDERGLRLVDVREKQEWDLCRIPEAELLPLSQFAGTAMEILNPEEEIVVYCHHGMRSERAGLFLEQNGYANVSNLIGGIDAWSLQVDSTVQRY